VSAPLNVSATALSPALPSLSEPPRMFAPLHSSSSAGPLEVPPRAPVATASSTPSFSVGVLRPSPLSAPGVTDAQPPAEPGEIEADGRVADAKADAKELEKDLAPEKDIKDPDWTLMEVAKVRCERVLCVS
jgi:hypothetical protein